LQGLGKHGKAIDWYDQAIKLKAGYANAYNGKGYSLQALEKHGKTIVFYDKSINLYPVNCLCFEFYG
jgi:tetratricopeptide (TPR) repeat protein